MKVRTRFAPSPTGYLHIGGVRTALYNWLFARKHGGEFILRIDDTDKARNNEEAVQPILHGLQWLGLGWDESYRQSDRLEFHQEACERLREYGFARQDDDGATRLEMPREGACVIEDAVRGRVEFPWSNEKDCVIQRADGTPTYHLATVVDDSLLDITHVIRAEEHLSNTPRQFHIYSCLGWLPPTYAHLPYVAEPGSKAKLSKRKLDQYLTGKHFYKIMYEAGKIMQEKGYGGQELDKATFNPIVVDFYEKIGYHTEALLNYLLLLGWALDGSREDFTIDEMIEHFTLERVRPSPSSFDPAKLAHFQKKWSKRKREAHANTV